MCGGKVLISTCSRVGHVFRKISPYSWPGGVVNILNHNTMRTAEVWMDKHKEFFYKVNPCKSTFVVSFYDTVHFLLQMYSSLMLDSFPSLLRLCAFAVFLSILSITSVTLNGWSVFIRDII